jgi:hypothetical protein
MMKGMDEIIKLYMRHVDREMIRENLKLTVTERLERMMAVGRFVKELQRGGRVIDLDAPGAQSALWREWKASSEARA